MAVARLEKEYLSQLVSHVDFGMNIVESPLGVHFFFVAAMKNMQGEESNMEGRSRKLHMCTASGMVRCGQCPFIYDFLVAPSIPFFCVLVFPFFLCPGIYAVLSCTVTV